MLLKQAFVVALGGALGALARWRLSGFNAPDMLPLGTLTANLLGCLALGALMSFLRPGSLLFLFVAAGLCGGLTTYSTFILELVSAKSLAASSVYALISLFGGLLCMVAGLRLGRLLGA
jgi:CrcB protein